MKTIMVFNIPADSGGALTILKQYYNQAILQEDINWIFVISRPRLENYKNIKILNFPFAKKNWFNRIIFDSFYEKKLIKKYKPDKLISLQNSILKSRIEQSVYIHNPLPFSKIKFSIIKEPKMWLYKNVVKRKVKKALKKSDEITVQTTWMKEACIKMVPGINDKIKLQPPTLEPIVSEYKHKKVEQITFFYPASNLKYKNHDVILNAMKKIDRNLDYKVIFTLDKNDKNNKNIVKVVKENRLNVEFIGNLQYENVLKKYSESILIFPSYLETYGLPLKEASVIGSPIIASNTEFAREILLNYKDVLYFEKFDYNQLAKHMEKHINYKGNNHD